MVAVDLTEVEAAVAFMIVMAVVALYPTETSSYRRSNGGSRGQGHGHGPWCDVEESHGFQATTGDVFGYRMVLDDRIARVLLGIAAGRWQRNALAMTRAFTSTVIVIVRAIVAGRGRYDSGRTGTWWVVLVRKDGSC